MELSTKLSNQLTLGANYEITLGSGKRLVVEYVGTDTVPGFHWVRHRSGYPLRVHVLQFPFPPVTTDKKPS